MAKRRKRSALRFFLGMMIYALFFVVFLAMGLRLFWGYIDNFEREQPSHAIERYLESFDSAHIRSLSQDFVATLDPALRSEEDSYRIIEQLFSGRLRHMKKSAESSDTHLVFAIMADDRFLGTMTLDATGEGGDNAWRVSSESFEFFDLLNSQEILVPSEWQIRCNGNVLGEEYITEKGIRYPSMEEAYDYGFELPRLVRYKLSRYIGTLELDVRDAEGESAQPKDDPALYTLGDRCTADERARMEDYTRRFLPLYIAFMSNTNHNAYANFAQVRPYLLPGSDLEARFREAIGGQTYSHSKGDVLHDVVVNGVFSIGEGKFLIDVDYKVDTTGNAGTIENDAGMLIVAEDHGADGIFASELFIK